MSSSNETFVDRASQLDAACDAAMRLQLAGQLDRAEQLYSSVLHADRAHAVANHCFGMLQVQLLRPATALPYLVNAVNEHPQNPDYWLGYLEALLQSGRIADAVDTLRLARGHGLSGPTVDAFARRLEAAGETAPRSTASAAVPPKKRRDKKQREKKGLRREDDALQKLIAQKRFSEALVMARSVTQRFPQHGVGWKQLGALLCWKGLFDEALTPLQNSVRLLPGDAEAHSNFGVALLHEKRVEDALTNFRRAIQIDPRFAAAHYHLGMTHLQEQRYSEGEDSLRTAVALRPDYLAAEVRPVHSELLHLYSHNPNFDARSLFAEHCKFTEYFEMPVRGSWPRHGNSRDPSRRLRVGFVSGDLLDHSVATFLEPVVARLRTDHLEMHAYHNRDAEDEVTVRLRNYFHAWHPVAALNDVALADKVTADGIDVLVDLSGHTALNRLRTFARKPAPIQISWLGYPGTTGLGAMDYYVADARWLPPDQFESLFTESLVYLPDRWAFVPHPKAPAIGSLPALATGRLTFGSFHRFGKINSFTIGLWTNVLCAVPESRLLMAGISAEQQAVLINRFAASGVAAGRLLFHPRCKMEQYLGLHNHVDVALDTQPYSGATTTMHSLSMGVPTLTIAGDTSWAAACAGILRHVQLDGFIAANASEFVARAVYWAANLNELAGLRTQLRTRLMHSAAGQPDLIAAHFEGALRHMWRRWCDGLAPHSFHSAVLAHDDGRRSNQAF